MNEKLVLQDLVEALSKKAKITKKEADLFFREFFQLILDRIFENDLVKIKDFGTFKLTSISSRESVDVNTGEKIEIPAHFRLTFSPDKILKNLVNKPFSQFDTILLEDGVDFGVVEIENDEDLDEDLKDADPELSLEKEDKSERVIEQPLEEKTLKTKNDKELVEDETEKIEPVSLPKRNLYPKSFVYTYTSSSAETETVSITVPKDDLSHTVSKTKKEQLTQASNIDNIILEKKSSTLNVQTDSTNRDDKTSPLVEIRPRPTKGNQIDIVKKQSIDELDLDSEIETEEDVVFSTPLTPLYPEPSKSVLSGNQIDSNTSTSQIHNALERPLLPLDELEEINDSVPSDLNDPINIDFSENEEEDLGSSYSAYDTNVNDLQLGEKPTLAAKLRKNLPVVIMMFAILIFGIYGFLSVFDVKHEYEYYLGRNNQAYSGVDTSALSVEAPKLGIDVDSVSQSVIESDESVQNIPLDTNLPTDIKNELGVDEPKKEKLITDSVSTKIDTAKPNVSKSDRVISPLLDIGVVNKGTFYLSKLSQYDKNSIVDKTVGNKEIGSEKKDENRPVVSNNSLKTQSVTLERGTTLRSLASKFYGDPSYWVYIYQSNRAELSNPNDITMGMKVTIPELSDYGIDNLKDPTSIQKAKELESQLLRW